MQAIADAREQKANASTVSDLTKVATGVGEVVHFAQRERAASSLMLSSKGASGADALAAARRGTDEAFAALEATLDDVTLPADVAEAMQGPLGQLGRRAEVRKGVDDLTGDVQATVKYYSDLNSSMLDSLGPMSAASTDAGVTRSLGAYLVFMQAKERVGQERAQLNNAFTADAFAEGQFATVVGLRSAQGAYLATFVSLATPDAAAAWDERAGTDVAQEVVEMEAVALSHPEGGFGVDPAVWMEAVTAKIDLMKEVEDLQAGAILVAAGGLHASAVSSERWLYVVTAVVMVVAVGCAVVLSRRITRPLQATAGSLGALAGGDLTREVEVRGDDEIGRMGRALNSAVVSVRDMVVAIGDRAGRLSGSAERLSAVSGSLASNAGATAAMAEATTVGTDEVRQQAAQLAAATEELRAGFQEVASAAAGTAEVARSAVGMASEASSSVGQLEEISRAIASLSQVIDAIAEQTNL